MPSSVEQHSPVAWGIIKGMFLSFCFEWSNNNNKHRDKAPPVGRLGSFQPRKIRKDANVSSLCEILSRTEDERREEVPRLKRRRKEATPDHR